MPDSALSQAIREAYATAPTEEVILHTLEIRHVNFTQPIRVVLDHQDLLAKMEAGAPLNPGEWVTFRAFSFEFVPPPSYPQANPEVSIAVDNVSREISDALEAAIDSMEPVAITYRPYLASNPSQPEMNPPMHMTVLSGQIDVYRAMLRAGFTDFANMKFPSQMYTAARFPGLVR